MSIIPNSPYYIKDLTTFIAPSEPRSWTGTIGSPSTIYYSFESVNNLYSDVIMDELNPNGDRTVSDLTSDQITAATTAMTFWSNVCNIRFEPADGIIYPQLVFGQLDFGSDIEDAAGAAPSNLSNKSGTLLTHVDVFVNPNLLNFYTIGEDGFKTFLHEIGHALGLSHPKGDGESPFYDTDKSVMSYFAKLHGNGYEIVSTPTVYDIATAQLLYGANHEYNKFNDTYEYVDGDAKAFTIWDGGGVDIIRSTYNGNVTIDLREGFEYETKIGFKSIWIAFGADIENAEGGSGNDTIYGNDLNNSLRGNGGYDTYYFSGTELSADTVIDNGGYIGFTNGLPGLNFYSPSATIAAGEYLFSLSKTGNHLKLTDTGGAGSVTVNNFYLNNDGIKWNLPVLPTDLSGMLSTISGTSIIGTSAANKMVLTGAGTAYGREGDDYLLGSSGDDLMYGEKGTDLLTGGAGDDILSGGEGADQIYGGAGNDVISSGDAGVFLTDLASNTYTNLLFGGDGDDTLFGDRWNDTLYGGNGNDTIQDIYGSNLAYGGAGDDSLYMGSYVYAGNNTVHGGTGNDTITFYSISLRAIWQPGDGNDILNPNGSGTNDFLQLNGVDYSELYIYRTTLDAIVEYVPTGEKITIANQFSTSPLQYKLETLELSSDGSTYSLTVINSWRGTDANDTLNGSAAADTLKGGLGNDLLSGYALDDSLDGEDGDDIVIGGSGGDVLIGGSGIDLASYEGSTAGVNVSMLLTTAQSGGDAAGDELSGFEKLKGSSYNDTLTGDMVNNELYGMLGNDTLTGNAGNDLLEGWENNDRLTGGKGADTLNGGTGNDYLIGSAGRDFITGGTEADTFKFNTLTESLKTSYDRVTDFLQGTDVINLSGLGFTSVQLGTGSGSILGYRQAGGKTYIEDADSNFGVEFTGTINLTNSDFVFV